MNKLNQVIIAFFILGLITTISAREISLFDYKGDAIAYIDTNDEMNIYLWEGKPVAYVNNDSVYGFNGKHLGWLKQGIIRDHNGYAVGFIEGSVSMLTNLESLKGLQELTPLKSLEELEPLEALEKNQWARLPLKNFLLMGK